MSDYGFLNSERCPACNNLIPKTVPAGRCPYCKTYLMEIDIAQLSDFEKLLEIIPSYDDSSAVNVHTFLFAMFNCQNNSIELFQQAIKRMDDLGYEATFDKIKHIWPIEVTEDNLLITAKLILDLET